MATITTTIATITSHRRALTDLPTHPPTHLLTYLDVTVVHDDTPIIVLVWPHVECPRAAPELPTEACRLSDRPVVHHAPHLLRSSALDLAEPAAGWVGGCVSGRVGG